MNGLFESRRFWLAVASLIFQVVSANFDLAITEEQLQLIVLTVAAWIVGDSIRETKPKASFAAETHYNR